MLIQTKAMSGMVSKCNVPSWGHFTPRRSIEPSPSPPPMSRGEEADKPHVVDS